MLASDDSGGVIEVFLLKCTLVLVDCLAHWTTFFAWKLLPCSQRRSIEGLHRSRTPESHILGDCVSYYTMYASSRFTSANTLLPIRRMAWSAVWNLAEMTWCYLLGEAQILAFPPDHNIRCSRFLSNSSNCTLSQPRRRCTSVVGCCWCKDRLAIVGMSFRSARFCANIYLWLGILWSMITSKEYPRRTVRNNYSIKSTSAQSPAWTHANFTSRQYRLLSIYSFCVLKNFGDIRRQQALLPCFSLVESVNM